MPRCGTGKKSARESGFLLAEQKAEVNAYEYGAIYLHKGSF